MAARKQARLTAQRILAEHLRDDRTKKLRSTDPPSPRFWPGIHLDLAGATLIDFELVYGVMAGTSFRGATFSGDAEFDGATFSGNAVFDGATFSGDARFDGATFSEVASFFSVTFGGYARFEGATFSGSGDSEMFSLTQVKALYE
jgi:uncharacterized protein YjbI with pentapeptide repeats